MSTTSSTSSTSTSLSLTGTIGGVKISDLIAAQDSANRSRATTLQGQETSINIQTAALTAVQNSLNALYSALDPLSQTALYESKAGSLGNSALGTVAVDSGSATNGSWNVNVLQVATSSLYVGQKASPIPAGSATVDSVFGTAGLGTIRVGTAGGTQQTVTISTGETLDQVASAMQTALGSGSSVSYDGTTGKFTVNAGQPLLLSAGTSNFLQQAQLFNNYSIISAAPGSAGAVTYDQLGSGSTKTMADYFGSGFVPGTMTINGTAVTISASDTIDTLAAHLQALTGLTLSVNSGGQMTINSANPVTIDTGTTSFAQQAGLTISTATSTTSQNGIGDLDPTAALGGSGGSITINGTTVTYSATDSLNTLIANINNSSAGVVAVYDSYHDRLGFVSDNAGPNAISISGVTGALANYGIVDSGGNEAGTFTAGNSAVVSVNGGASITSDSNTFTSDQLGIAGVTFTAAAVGTTALTVAPDVTNIEKAIDAFVTQYNLTQNVLAQYTNPNGVTTTDPTTGATSTSAPGVLISDSSVNQAGYQLRSIFGSLLYNNSSASYQTLSSLGIEGNDTDNTATLSDPTALTDALTNHLSDVLNIFANPANGLFANLSDLLINEASGGASVIGTEISTNNQQISSLDDQISIINEQADAQKALLETEYGNYESAFQTSQSTSSYLNANSSGGTNSSSSNTSGGILG